MIRKKRIRETKQEIQIASKNFHLTEKKNRPCVLCTGQKTAGAGNEEKGQINRIQKCFSTHNCTSHLINY